MKKEKPQYKKEKSSFFTINPNFSEPAEKSARKTAWLRKKARKK